MHVQRALALPRTWYGELCRFSGVKRGVHDLIHFPLKGHPMSRARQTKDLFTAHFYWHGKKIGQLRSRLDLHAHRSEVVARDLE